MAPATAARPAAWGGLPPERVTGAPPDDPLLPAAWFAAVVALTAAAVPLPTLVATCAAWAACDAAAWASAGVVAAAAALAAATAWLAACWATCWARVPLTWARVASDCALAAAVLARVWLSRAS